MRGGEGEREREREREKTLNPSLDKEGKWKLWKTCFGPWRRRGRVINSCPGERAFSFLIVPLYRLLRQSVHYCPCIMNGSCSTPHGPGGEECVKRYARSLATGWEPCAHTHTHPVCTETHTNRHAEVYLTSLSLTPCLGFSVVYRLSVSLSVSLSLSISLHLFLSRLLTLHLSLSNKLSFNLSFVVIPSL